MGQIVLSVFLNLILMFVLAGFIAYMITQLLNPTASPAEIFNHWKKVWKNEYNVQQKERKDKK